MQSWLLHVRVPKAWRGKPAESNHGRRDSRLFVHTTSRGVLPLHFHARLLDSAMTVLPGASTAQYRR